MNTTPDRDHLERIGQRVMEAQRHARGLVSMREVLEDDQDQRTDQDEDHAVDTTRTRADALHYVSLTLGDYCEDYDLEAITDDVHQQLGHWDFAAMDQDGTEVDYWETVRRHELPISSAAVPQCPSWCTLDKGHEYDVTEDDGSLTGFHEGRLATVTDDDGGQVSLTMVQQVSRRSDGSATVRPAYVTLTTTAGGTEYTTAASLRDLGDAIRKTAGQLEQLTEGNGR